LPWDGWGIIDKEYKDLTADEIALLDRVAKLTQGDVPAFDEMRSLYENDERLRVPPVIKSYRTMGVQTIEIAGEVKV
jgi:hypothetical protein